MSRAVNVVLGMLVVITTLFLIPASMAGSGAGLGLLALYFYYVVVATPLAIFGLFALWRYPPQRRKAAIIVLLPVTALLLPPLIQKVTGGSVRDEQIIGLLVVLAIAAAAASMIAPKRVAAFIPKALFRSRIWNGLIVVALLLAWIFVALVAFWLFGDLSSSYRRDTGMGLAYALLATLMFVLGISAVSAFALVWASLGLRGGVERACRKLNITQIVIAVPGILAGGLVLVWMINQS